MLIFVADDIKILLLLIVRQNFSKNKDFMYPSNLNQYCLILLGETMRFKLLRAAWTWVTC